MLDKLSYQYALDIGILSELQSKQLLRSVNRNLK